MSAWFEGLVPAGYETVATMIVAGLVVLAVLFVVVRVLRGFASGTFVSGGRNRRARLAVMDAAAVDSRRRLVLVRRDDVEHLILIGGPTDVVIEQDIKMITPGRRHTDIEPEPPVAKQPVAPAAKPREPAAEAPRPRLVSPAPPAPIAVTAKAPEPVFPAASARENGPRPQPAAFAPQAARPEPAFSAPRPAPAAPVRPPEPRAEPVPLSAQRAPEPAEPRAEPLREAAVVTPLPIATEARTAATTSDDEALLKELEVTLDGPGREHPDSGPDDISLEEEMSKLLGDLSGDRR